MTLGATGGRRGGRAFRQDDGHNESAGRSPHCCDVIGIDMHGVPTKLGCGECDGVRADDEVVLTAGVDEGGVLPYSRAENDAGVRVFGLGQDFGEEFRREFADVEGGVFMVIACHAYGVSSGGRRIAPLCPAILQIMLSI